MRPIKFRGRDIVTKRFVYGFYCKCGDTGLSKILTFKKGFQGFYPLIVDPDSVAQLVGYDGNGKEVYEGDTLIDELEQEYIARIYDPPQCIAALTLKEQSV